MSIVEDIEKRYNIGQPILKKIFDMDYLAIKGILLKICNSNEAAKEVITNGFVYKSSRNDEPQSIEICSYSCVSVSVFGVYYKPEHGEKKLIVEFGEFFKLD